MKHTSKQTNKSTLTSRDFFMFAGGFLLHTLWSLYSTSSQDIKASWIETAEQAVASLQPQSIESNQTSVLAATSSVAKMDGSKSAQEDGFHPIHIYFGKDEMLFESIPEDGFWRPVPGKAWVEQDGRSWFSQHAQDVVVLYALDFPRNGFFVDLAANHAIWASNTFSLEQHFGWRGICIEANSYYWHDLAHRHCHVVGAIAGKTENEKVLVNLQGDKAQGPFGGIISSQMDNTPNKNYPKREPRLTVSLMKILDKFQAPTVIDYMSLDVEGAEELIMLGFPWDKYKFRCMTVERPSEALQKEFQENGYVKVRDLKFGDTLWMPQELAKDAEERLNQAPKFEFDNKKRNGDVKLPPHALPPGQL